MMTSKRYALALLFLFCLQSCTFTDLLSPNGSEATFTPVPSATIIATPAKVITPSGILLPVPEPDLSDFVDHYLAVDGSTSTAPLQLLIACHILNVDQNCKQAVYERGNGAQEKVIYYYAESPDDAQLSIQHYGTHESYVNLIEGKADLILVARAPSDHELLQAGSQNVDLSIYPIALDAFVFIANKQNPIDSLTLDQVRGIYSGKITDWSALGWEGEINAYQREDDSGSQELMKQMVMKHIPIINAPDMIVYAMTGPYIALHDDPLGIGYSVFYYANFMIGSPNIKLLGIDGIVPSTDTIRDRTYPLVTEVYIVTRADLEPSSQTVRLRDWMLSESGQEIVAKSGYVPIYP